MGKTRFKLTPEEAPIFIFLKPNWNQRFSLKKEKKTTQHSFTPQGSL